MISFATRRWLGVIFLALLAAGLLAAYHALAPTVPRLSYLSGWLLFLLVLGITGPFFSEALVQQSADADAYKGVRNHAQLEDLV